MMVQYLSRTTYSDRRNYGDCILIDSDELVIYDCGSIEHAQQILAYMDAKGYAKAKMILSHGDPDHIAGLPYLLEHQALSTLYAFNSLSYTKELSKRSRLSESKVEASLRQIFSNLYPLIENLFIPLVDPFKGSKIEFEVASGIRIIGPSLDFALEQLSLRLNDSKHLCGRENIINTLSLQVEVESSPHKLLLCGDTCYEAIADKLAQYSHIHLPHHGRGDHAERIFTQLQDHAVHLYVSDNNRCSNSGMRKLLRQCPRMCTLHNSHFGPCYFPV